MSRKGLSMSILDADAHQRRNGFTPIIGQPQDEPQTRPAAIRQPKGPNKTEAAFGLILEVRFRKGEFVAAPMFEGVKLRIAGNCYYCPDWFCVSMNDRRPVFFEVKGGGPIRDDSIVKFKASSELHRWADFEMWRKTKSGWGRIR